jgi:hypothetical protein
MDVFIGSGLPVVIFGEKPGQPAQPFQFHGIQVAETSCGIKTRKGKKKKKKKKKTKHIPSAFRDTVPLAELDQTGYDPAATSSLMIRHSHSLPIH